MPAIAPESFGKRVREPQEWGFFHIHKPTQANLRRFLQQDNPTIAKARKVGLKSAQNYRK